MSSPNSGTDLLLEGEDPSTRHAGDARRWAAAYRELVAYANGVLEREQGERSADSADSPTGNVVVLLDRRNRFVRRLQFWERRSLELSGGVDYDQDTGLIQHGGQLIRLSNRESQLFAFLLQHPGRAFTPDELATQAWQASHLSAKQVRNYVVRLRRKLTGLPWGLIREPVGGYSLKSRRLQPGDSSATHRSPSGRRPDYQ